MLSLPQSGLAGAEGYPFIYGWSNPEFERPDLVTIMEIRLIYKGQLLATGNDHLKPVSPERDRDIHRIRRDIHQQLKTLWDKHPTLVAKKNTGWMDWATDWKSHSGNWFLIKQWRETRSDEMPPNVHTEIEALGNRFKKCDFQFVPLVNDLFNTVCALDILFLRREDPGQLITTQSGGDIDNRIKTLLDALQIPSSCTQIDGLPTSDETPFYTLLQDDGLVTELKVTTDRLLMPLGKREQQNDVVLIIHAHIKTSQSWFDAEDDSGLGADNDVQ